MKRILLACLTVGFLAACQDAQLPTDSNNLTESPDFKKGGNKGKKNIHAQINAAMKAVFPPGTRGGSNGPNNTKGQIFGAVGDGNPEFAATLFFEQMLPLMGMAQNDYGASAGDVLALTELFLEFVGVPGNVEVLDPADGGVVTNDGNPVSDEAGVFFDENELPGTEPRVVGVVKRPQPCHPLAVFSQADQRDYCYEFFVSPPLDPGQEFNYDEELGGVLVGVCFVEQYEGEFEDFRLYRSEGPDGPAEAFLLPEEPEPFFLECEEPEELGSSGSNWMVNFARAGWQKVGAPIASVFAPQPLQASVLALGTAGSYGARTKKFSNIGWALLEEERPDLVIDELGIDSDPVPNYEWFEVTVSVRNAGSATASEFLVAIEVCAVGAVGCLAGEEDFIFELEAGAGTDVIFECRVEGPDNYILRAEADGEDQVEESDELNNTDELSFAVGSGFSGGECYVGGGSDE